jgi:hypothetical protein
MNAPTEPIAFDTLVGLADARINVARAQSDQHDFQTASKDGSATI